MRVYVGCAEMLHRRTVGCCLAKTFPRCITMGLSVSTFAKRQEVYVRYIQRVARIQPVALPGAMKYLLCIQHDLAVAHCQILT